jgi:hypothetical protein
MSHIINPHAIFTVASMFSQAVVFPVTSPEIQWQFDADSLLLTAGTTYPVSTVFNCGVTGDSIWKLTSQSATATAYTKSNSSQGIYLSMPTGTNLSTVNSGGVDINSYNGTTILTNLGYTMWFSYFYNGTSGWARQLWYLGTGANNTTSTVPQSTEYGNIILFQNDADGTQWRFGTNPTLTLDSSFTNTGVVNFNNTTYLRTVVLSYAPTSFNTLPQSSFTSGRWSTYNTATNSFIQTTTTAFAGTLDQSASVGVRSGTTGRPILADSSYFQAKGMRLLYAGFANRPYSTIEIQTLYNWLMNKAVAVTL